MPVKQTSYTTLKKPQMHVGLDTDLDCQAKLLMELTASLQHWQRQQALQQIRKLESVSALKRQCAKAPVRCRSLTRKGQM